MLLSCNPPKKGIENIILASKHKAAKWIKDSATGDTWYWPAEDAYHANVADLAGVSEYTKGIAVMEQ